MTSNLDVAIFGGGIAGLWTLARLRRAGYRAMLFESETLGGVQSIASQGIIHGGTKYALTGKLTGSALAIGEMPEIWRAALAGEGEVDLRRVGVLASHQLLWTTGSLASGIAGFFAGKVMHSRMQALPRDDFPQPFDAPAFDGALYRLDEPVLDPITLAAAFEHEVGDACYRTFEQPTVTRSHDGWQIGWSGGALVNARSAVLAAGAGNGGLLAAFGQASPAMQLRPLHMVMLRGDLPSVYAHCLGASATPRLTVTSYPTRDGRVVWYLGGQLAEEGVGRDVIEQVGAARQELASVLPWMDFSRMEWATLRVDRAEAAMPGLRRPDDAFVAEHDHVVACWPTKLAFAPRVARLVMAELERLGIRPSAADESCPAPVGLARPMLSRLPWDAVERWV